jgi:hypothetical protein
VSFESARDGRENINPQSATMRSARAAIDVFGNLLEVSAKSGFEWGAVIAQRRFITVVLLSYKSSNG